MYSILESFNQSLFRNFVLVGDFNVDFCNSSQILYQKLLTILSSFSLSQVVPSPTHTTSCTGKSTLVDLALVSSPAAVDCSVIPPIGSSDHLGIPLIIRNQRSAKCAGPSKLIWRYTAADWDRTCELLNSIEWNDIFSGDINHVWTLWEHKFMAVMEECIPRVKLTKRCNLPWSSKNHKRAMQKHNQLFRRVRRTRSARLMKAAKK